MQETMISPELYEEKIRNFSLKELMFERFKQDSSIKSEINKHTSMYITRCQYMNIINKLIKDEKHENEFLMNKIEDLIKWEDPREMNHYRNSDLEKFHQYSNVNDLPQNFELWKKMAMVELEEERIMNPLIDYDIDKLVQEKKEYDEKVANGYSEKLDLSGLMENIDSFINRINNPDADNIKNDKYNEEQKEVLEMRELRKKLAEVIRFYCESEMPNVEFSRNELGQTIINYPSCILNLKEYMELNPIFNKTYNINIQDVMGKEIPTLNMDEALGYIYYVFNIENQQKGFMAKLINSNAFVMLCTRIYNITYRV